MKIWIDPKSIKSEDIEKIRNRFLNHEISVNDISYHDAEVAIVMPNRITEDFLNHFKKLKLIKLLTAGYDQVDLMMLKERGIALAYAKDVYSIQIAEDVLAKMLYFNRHLYHYYDLMKEKRWEFKTVKHELYQSTIGIIGAGSIGNEIAKRLKSFECKILGYRRSNMISNDYDSIYHDRKGLEYILKNSDYIIISLPLTQQTKHLIGMKELKLMKTSSILINVARGDIIDQEALINALNKDYIRGACLDVTSQEPLASSDPLWHAKNIFITPHQASSSPTMNDRMIDEVIKTLDKYINNETLTNLVSLSL